MSKLRKATKKITAVAAASAMLASSAMAGGLGSYPSNFVEDGKFAGQVVVGSAADAMDTTNANAIIEDLKAEFSGEADKVRITYKKAGTGGEEVEIEDSGKELNFGENLKSVKTSAFDDGDSDVLEDDSLKLKTTEDYTQELEFATNGYFEHALRDDIEDEISTHVYFKKGDIVQYKLELDTDMNLSEAVDGDIIGKKIMIMGNEFTIGDDYSKNSAKSGLDKLKLIGGANKISLGEGETTKVTVDGKEYEIEISSVSSEEVLLSVNGQSQTIDEYDSEVVSGISIAVTDLVESSRDSVKGYAEFVVGGQEILLEHGKEVKINEEKISDIHDDYLVKAYFNDAAAFNTAAAVDTSFAGFRLVYSWDQSDGFYLEENEAFEDKVFQAFSINYEGTNDVEYSTVEVSGKGQKISLSGTTIDGEDYSEDIGYILTKAATEPVRLIGGDEDVPMLVKDFTASNLDVAEVATPTTKNASLTPAELSGTRANDQLVVFDRADSSRVIFTGIGSEVNALFNVAAGVVESIKADKADDGLRFLTGDADNQKLYSVTGFSTDSTTSANNEFDFEEILASKTKADIKVGDVGSKLDDLTFTMNASNDGITVITNTDASGVNTLSFADEIQADLTKVAAAVETSTEIKFTYDTGDMTLDGGATDAPAITLDFTAYDATDDEFTFNILAAGYISNWQSGAEYDVADDDDNTQEFVNAYGTKIIYDAEEKTEVKIMTPDEQVEATVKLVFGGEAAQTMTTTVDSDKVEETKEELEADGYTIVDTEDVAAEEVEFDVAAAVLDSDVSGSDDMIVVGGPAVNSVARELMDIEVYSLDLAGVAAGEGMIKYFEEANSVLVYGYSAADTTAAVAELNNGGLSGNEKKVQ